MTRPERLTSRHHAIVKRCRALAARRAGDARILLDGAHLVHEAIRAGVRLEAILSDGRGAATLAHAGPSVAIYDATRDVLDAASPVRTPSGIVAIAEWSPAPIAAVLAGTRPLVLGLVDVQDPGNVGSAIRAADALGATGVLALGDSADPGGWKALRGAMGSTFHLPVGRGAWSDAATEARRRGLRVIATVADQGEDIDAVDLRRPALLLLGNEGSGLPGEVMDDADIHVTVPMRPGVSSLNVAVTAALLLFEARRQREHPAR